MRRGQTLRFPFAAGLICLGACAPQTRAPDPKLVAVEPAASTLPPALPPSATTLASSAPICPPLDYPKPAIDPTCSDVTLKSGQSWKEQLTLQLSSGATTRIDCPRMRFQGQDTPLCVVRNVGGRLRGACCPPGHTDPTDPACVGEGPVDAMYKRKKVWEWCSTTQDPPMCEPCVWVTGAKR